MEREEGREDEGAEGRKREDKEVAAEKTAKGGGIGEGHRGRWKRRKEAERERSIRGTGDNNLMLAPVHCQKG